MPTPPVDGLLRFIDASPSPYHAAANLADRLAGAGFERVGPGDGPGTTGRGVTVDGGSLVAWSVPASAPPDRGAVVLGAHTDSPNLRLKPQPDTGRAGWRQLGVEVYGGVLLNSWLDRDLGLSGRLAVRDGAGAAVALVRVDRPVLRVPQLAIHLDREVNQGLALNPQTQLVPVWGLGTPSDGDLVGFLAAEAGVAAADVLAFDVMAHDLTPAARLGRDEELLAAPRLDNLCSCWCAVEALLDAESADGDGPVRAVVLFDHEEVGSQSATGAGSPLARRLLERVTAAGGGDDGDRHRAMASTYVVSADMAHAAHPNYLDRMEPGHHVLPNAGPVLKTNANVRYASDAATSARFRLACEDAGVPVQTYVNRTDLACGSTIGPVTAANLGAGVVDVGLAQLSMHSARELAGADDPPMMVAAMASLLRGAGE